MNIKVGDTVKVIGKTIIGADEAEPIKIGTICKVIEVNYTEKEILVDLVPLGKEEHWNDGWWYSTKDVEKGHLEWIPDKD